jgi:3-oxoacyl-[acyl-carrier protein] reductase
LSETPVALVTGVRTGLGFGLARHLSKIGYRVVGCSRRRPPDESSGLDFVQADVADARQVQELLRVISARYSRLDICINNAGVQTTNHVLLSPETAIETMIRTNVLGTVLVSRGAARLMARRKRGHIVNISSIQTLLATPGAAVYAATKSAVEQFTRVFAKEVRGFGIAVNCVAPPLIRGSGMESSEGEERLRASLGELAGSAAVSVEEVIETIMLLIKQQSLCLTGQTIFMSRP